MKNSKWWFLPLLVAASCNSPRPSGEGEGEASTAADQGTPAAPTSLAPTTERPTTTVPAPTAPATTAPVVLPSADEPIGPATVAFSLPEGFEYPEGIAVDPATRRAYVTSTPSGAVAIADPGDDTASVWLAAGTDGRALTLGIEFDRDSVWLVSPPTLWEYATDGTLRGSHLAEGSVMLNDVAITEQGIFVSDSSLPTLWFLPRGAGEDDPLQPIDLSATSDVIGAPFELNGIEALPDGSLLGVHFFNGMLFHIDARHLPDATAEQVDLDGYLLTVGDGMTVKGGMVWVTRGAAGDTIDRVSLCPSYECGTVMAGLADPGLSFPTDVDIRGDQLLVVNSQFDNGGGLGDGVPTKPFTVAAIPIALD